MGTGIAETLAISGYEVIVRSRSPQTAEALLAGLEKSLDKQISKGSLESSRKEEILSRCSATCDLAELSDVDIVIESIVEELETKRHLFNELDRVCKDTTILATNTSTLPVVEIAMATGRPDRVCGMHFFNPAVRMPLVEIVRQITVSDEVIEEVKGFAESCGKTPVIVPDRAGFIVNALLFPYLNNAVRLLEQAVATRDDIDLAMKGGCGFPMGPFALLDLIGLDTSLAILETLYNEYKDPNYSPAPLLRRMVAAEMLGRKTHKGFYDYHDSHTSHS